MPDEKNSQVSRRKFLKKAAVLGTTLAGSGALARVLEPTAVEAQTKVVPKAMGYVLHNSEKCAGCRTCMTVCSLYHEGAVSIELSRIHVIESKVDIFNIKAYTCKQCEGPECLYACPTGALHVDKETKARVIDAAKCIGCQTCVRACPQYPHSPIFYNASTKKCVKCDLCGGDPQCVKICPQSVSWSPSCHPVKEHPLKFVKNV